MGLTPREETPARTPLWLIVLRTILAALVIVGLAHPLVNPQTPLRGSGPLIVVIDDGWPAAHDWQARQAAATNLLAEAEREDRQIVLLTTAPPASDQKLPPLAPRARRRRARCGHGAGAEAVARRPQDRAGAPGGVAAVAGRQRGMDQRRGR